MKRTLISAAVAAFFLTLAQPTPAQDLAAQIVGVWKIKSFERKEIATGKLSKTFGENPNGIYTKGGHFSSNGFAEGRKVPATPVAGSSTSGSGGRCCGVAAVVVGGLSGGVA